MHNDLATKTNPQQLSMFPEQATDDEQLIALWLYGKSPATQAAYLNDVERFLLAIGNKPIRAIILADLQAFDHGMLHLADNTRRRSLHSIKSLLSFAAKLGYIHFNAGAAISAPKAKNTLAERILTEEEILRIIYSADKPRDRLLLRLLYACAGRVSEVCALKWRDVQPNGESGQVTLFGKGGETRAILLSAATWNELIAARGQRRSDEPVFRSQKGGHLSSRQVHRIVRAAASHVGIEGNVSPHWFRHAHASHAIDRGANIALVRDTLGHSSLAITSKYVHSRPDDSSALHLAI